MVDNTQDEQHLAFLEAHENPTTDHQLLEAFDTGEFVYKPYVKIKTPEEYEAEQWDKGRED